VPLRVNAFQIWQRLIPTFDLEESTVEDPPPELLTSIQPIYDIQKATLGLTRANVTLDLSGSAGTYVVGLTAGDDQRLLLEVISVVAMTANSRLILNASGVEIPLTVAGTGAVILFPVGITLGDGDSVGMDSTGDAGDSARVFQVRYKTEILRAVTRLP